MCGLCAVSTIPKVFRRWRLCTVFLFCMLSETCVYMRCMLIHVHYANKLNLRLLHLLVLVYVFYSFIVNSHHRPYHIVITEDILINQWSRQHILIMCEYMRSMISNEKHKYWIFAVKFIYAHILGYNRMFRTRRLHSIWWHAPLKQT